VEKQTELDVSSDERPNHQPRPGAVVCRASQESQGRSRGRQSRCLRLQAEGSRSSDRRSGNARSTELRGVVRGADSNTKLNMYAITGVTGKVGGATARALLAAGQSVRAVVRNVDKGQVWRNLGCDVALATIEDGASLSVAFQRAEAVFVLVPPNFDPTPEFSEAREVGNTLRSALAAARPKRNGFEADKLRRNPAANRAAIRHTAAEPRLQ